MNGPKHIARVVILEDDFFARDAMAQRLQRDDTIRVVGEAKTLSEAEEMLADPGRAPNLLLVDMDFPGDHDEIFDLISAANHRFPELRVLCLSLLPTQANLQRSLYAGVDGFMQKNECADGLGLAVERCMAGDFVTSPSVTVAFGRLRRNCFVIPPVDLPAEMANHLRQVAYLRYVRGLTRSQIAEDLVLSHLTVDSYLKEIKSILQIASRRNLLTRGFMVVTRLLWLD